MQKCGRLYQVFDQCGNCAFQIRFEFALRVKDSYSATEEIALGLTAASSLPGSENHNVTTQANFTVNEKFHLDKRKKDLFST